VHGGSLERAARFVLPSPRDFGDLAALEVMSIPIPVGTTQLATASGQRWKPVRCVHCKLEWAYLVDRKGRGAGAAPLFVGGEEAKKHASEQAEANLVRALDAALEPVRCPGCRKYQPAMVELLKDHRAMGPTLAAALAFIAALVFAARFEFAQAGAAALVCVVLYVIGRIRRARFSPPEDGETRFQTLLRTEWESTRAAHGSNAVPKVWWQDLA
jgi:hypothetical protein